MPAMADVVVKKYDGTTDITYTAMAPSSGDGVSAIWRSNSVSTIPGFRPEVSMVSAYNGPKTARRVTIKAKFASVVTGSDNVVRQVATIPLEFSALLPQNVAETDLNEAVNQFTNLLVAALPRSCIRAGFAAT